MTEAAHAAAHATDEASVDQIREAVRSLCARFPGEYWRTKDRERQYPTEFVAAMTDRLAALAAAVPAAENMPGPRRRAAQTSIAEQLDGIEADIMTRLGVL